MPANVGPITLAPAASTGNNTHDAVPVPADPDSLALEFRATAVGATPTVTFKYQGSNDGTNWFDLLVLPSDSDTGAVTQVKTAVGTYASFLSAARDALAYIRLVTSANTNVTYTAVLYLQDTE